MYTQIIRNLFMGVLLFSWSNYTQAQTEWEQVPLQNVSLLSPVYHQSFLSENHILFTSSIRGYFATQNYDFRIIMHDSSRSGTIINLWTTVVRPNRAIHTAGYTNPKVSFIQSLDTFRTWAPYYALNQDGDTLFLNTRDSLKHPHVIHFFDSLHAFIFADTFNNSMHYFTTNNGGNTWIKKEGESLDIQPTDVFNRLSSWGFRLCAFDSTSGYLEQFRAKQIYRITQKGKVISTIRFADTSVSIGRLLMLDTSIGFATLQYNNLLVKFAKTTDGGVTWDTTIAQPPLFNRFGWAPPTANREGFFYIHSLNTMTFYISTDTFKTFAYEFPRPQGEGFFYINFLNSEVGFASAQGGRVYKWNNVLPTSLKTQSALSKNINLYPNPCSELLYLPIDAKEILVRDLSGKLINVKRGTGFVDVSDFNNGIYFIQFSDENGHYYSKFLVNR